MAQYNIQKHDLVRTTINLPADLIRRSQPFVEAGVASSSNALIVAAVDHYVKHLERSMIDAQFAPMAEDADYHELSLQISEEFEESDWEALAGRRP